MELHHRFPTDDDAESVAFISLRRLSTSNARRNGPGEDKRVSENSGRHMSSSFRGGLAIIHCVQKPYYRTLFRRATGRKTPVSCRVPSVLLTPSPASRRKNLCGQRFSPSPAANSSRNKIAALRGPPLRSGPRKRGCSAVSQPDLQASPRGTPDKPDALGNNRREL